MAKRRKAHPLALIAGLASMVGAMQDSKDRQRYQNSRIRSIDTLTKKREIDVKRQVAQAQADLRIKKKKLDLMDVQIREKEESIKRLAAQTAYYEQRLKASEDAQPGTEAQHTLYCPKCQIYHSTQLGYTKCPSCGTNLTSTILTF